MTPCADDFGFGLEAEYLLVTSAELRPLWHPDLTFSGLNELLEGISLEGILPLDGLDVEAPHRVRMPYVVEGYPLTNPAFETVDILPKGVEIRTPVAGSIGLCLAQLRVLHRRLQDALGAQGLCAVALSHHPVAVDFEGPRNKRRDDWWRWSMAAMTTYGPDVNVSLPRRLGRALDPDELDAKVNYYAPALTAFSLASPFRAGSAWEVPGGVGKSLRTARRSAVGQAMELHPEEGGRIEFKSFEMTPRTSDFHAFFLLWLAVLLDPTLAGRATAAQRIEDLQNVAQQGWGAETVVERAEQVLAAAQATLPAHGFELDPLVGFRRRLTERRTPADELLELYHRKGGLPAVLWSLIELR